MDTHRWTVILADHQKNSEGFFGGDPDAGPEPSADSFLKFQEIWRRAKSLVSTSQLRLILSESDSYRKSQCALKDVPGENIIIQPAGWGNGASLLLTLLEIRRQDPQARVVLMPAHYEVENESILQSGVDRALQHAKGEDRHAVLLGLCPRLLEDYEGGWIIPSLDPRQTIHSVSFLVQRINPLFTLKLARRGALWNSSIVVAPVSVLLLFYMMAEPKLVWPVLKKFNESATSPDDIPMYDFVPMKDFHRNVLGANSHLLKVLPLKDCGWTLSNRPFRLKPPASLGRRHERTKAAFRTVLH